MINELIDEKLKIKESKRWGMELTDAEVDSMYANMASRMRQTADQLTQSLQKGGVNPQTSTELSGTISATAYVLPATQGLTAGATKG